MSKFDDVSQLGQSLWLNYMRRAFIESGQLRELLDQGIRGVTVDARVMERTIAGSSDYDGLIRRSLAEGTPLQQVHETLLIDDVQRAADILHGVYSESEHSDGFVSLPLDPALAHNTVSLIAEGQRLGGVCAAVDRPNIMIEVPATPAGIRAVESLIAGGCNLHVTHIYSLATYEEVAQAYLRGLETFFQTHSVWRMAPVSVASVRLALIDGEVNAALARIGRTDLREKAGVALAKVLYARFRQIFSGEPWARLRQRGGHLQRLLWIDTVPTSFGYGDVHYAEALIGPDTVHALSPATLHAFRDHGDVAPTLLEELEQAQAHLDDLNALGIELLGNAQQLQEKTLVRDAQTVRRLASSIAEKRDNFEEGWQRLQPVLSPHETAVRQGLQELCDRRIVCRIWQHDHTVWKGAPHPVSRRLAWMHIPEVMVANVSRLQKMVRSARADGYNEGIVLASSSAALAARVFATTFGALPYIPGILPYTAGPHMRLSVVDTADSDAVESLQSEHDLERTLLVISSKAGTPETMSAFTDLYLYLARQEGKTGAGDHFVVVTDHGSPLATAAAEYQVRDLFVDVPAVSPGYAALSYTGLVPASLTGLDLTTLLDHANVMACNANGCNCPLTGDNVAAQLGTIIGILTRNGCRRLTFLTSPFLAEFANWAGRLVVEATAGSGSPIAPVVGEPPLNPELYEEDRLFLYLRLAGDQTHDLAVNALKSASLPVVTLHLKELYELGGLFFTWQMAMIVAAYHLGLNPFSLPVTTAPDSERTGPA